MTKHLRAASAESFDGSDRSEDVFPQEMPSSSNIEFSRREVLLWVLFFCFVFLLLIIVLQAGKYFMLN